MSRPVDCAIVISGAGVIPTLPLLKPGLCAITAVYLLRGFAAVPLLAFDQPKSAAFVVWSSLLCIAFGLAHPIGLKQAWATL